MKNVTFTAIRNGGFHSSFNFERILVISACVTNDLTDVVGAIKKACSEWAKTPAGRDAYEDSSGDFNFGDLASYLGDQELAKALVDQGIVDLSIEDDIDVENAVSYDTVLMKDPEESNVN